MITVLEELNEEALIEILTKPKNAIVRQYQVLFAMEDVDIEFTPEALKAIAHQAIERKMGARGLRSIIEALLLDTMFEIPSRTDVAKVIVTEAVVTAKPSQSMCFALQNKSKRSSRKGGCSSSSSIVASLMEAALQSSNWFYPTWNGLKIARSVPI